MKYGRKDYETISVSISKDFKTKIKEMAEDSENTLSQVVDDIFREFFKTKTSYESKNHDLQSQLAAFKKCLQEANQSYLSLQAELKAVKKKEEDGLAETKEEIKALKADQVELQKSITGIYKELGKWKTPEDIVVETKEFQTYIDDQLAKKIPDLHKLKEIEDDLRKFKTFANKIIGEVEDRIPPDLRPDVKKIWREFASIDERIKEAKNIQHANYHNMRNYIEDLVKKNKFSIFKPWTWF